MKLSRRWLIISCTVSALVAGMAVQANVALASPSSMTGARSAHAMPYLVAFEEPPPSNQVVNIPEDPNLVGAPGQNFTPAVGGSGGSGGGGGGWILYVGAGALMLIGIAGFTQGQKK